MKAYAHWPDWARVVIAELNLASGSELSNLIQLEGGEAIFAQTDIVSAEAVTTLAAKNRAAFGTVDMLISNAILCPVSPVSLPVEMRFLPDVSIWVNIF